MFMENGAIVAGAWCNFGYWQFCKLEKNTGQHVEPKDTRDKNRTYIVASKKVPTLYTSHMLEIATFLDNLEAWSFECTHLENTHS